MPNVDSVERNFKGIWIPAYIWLSEGIGVNEKVLWANIDSLESPDRGCFATNGFLAKILNVSEKHVSRMISKLVKLGFVYSEDVNGERQLRITPKPNNVGTQKCVGGVRKNAEGGTQKCGEGVRKNAEQINKSNNKGIKKEDNNNTKATILDAQFDEFWKEYPNKKNGSSRAKEKFISKMKSGKVDFSTVMKSLADHKKLRQWVKDNGDFIPLATTWLNQERWDSEFKPSDFMDYVHPKNNHAGTTGSLDDFARRHGFDSSSLNPID